jgi:hypothetical protein
MEHQVHLQEDGLLEEVEDQIIMEILLLRQRLLVEVE